jgi:hypothetical protein
MTMRMAEPEGIVRTVSCFVSFAAICVLLFGAACNDEPPARCALISSCPFGDKVVGSPNKCIDGPSACYPEVDCTGVFWCTGPRPPQCLPPKCEDGDLPVEGLAKCPQRALHCYDLDGCGTTTRCAVMPPRLTDGGAEEPEGWEGEPAFEDPDASEVTTDR